MSNEATKSLQHLADVFKSLGHPTRLWIVRRLEHGECCVQDFVTGTREEFSTVSQHLNVLKHSGVVESERRGKQVFYQLRYPCIPWLIDCMEARDQFDHTRADDVRLDLRAKLEELLTHL